MKYRVTRVDEAACTVGAADAKTAVEIAAEKGQHWEPGRNLTRAVREITITMDGGLIQNIEGIPAGVCVVVRDYDTDGADDDRLTEEEDGKRCFVSTWSSKKE